MKDFVLLENCIFFPPLMLRVCLIIGLNGGLIFFTFEFCSCACERSQKKIKEMTHKLVSGNTKKKKTVCTAHHTASPNQSISLREEKISSICKFLSRDVD